MSDANRNQEEALFQAASELAGAERVAFLNGACHGNPALRQRLETLLAGHDAKDSFLEPDAPQPGRGPFNTMKIAVPEEPVDETVGTTIGRYKILEKVGEGGCGVVYVAEQTEPVRRRVALKVIKLGMDTKAVVARFEAERQALAMMDHPNIAKVLDAGTTEIGRPFFVMELVRGIRITDYCDQNNLPTKERLELFIKVCQAIQHAHQKGIIHRDIKPSNILVTLHDGVPVPKVIDFGIAKATEGRLTDATVYTQLHQFIGTPAYMSPEQAEMSGLDIDTRSDIYSLGVLLYELLTGSTPFDSDELVASGIDGMRKTIREKEPIRPSTRFATLEGEELTTTAKRRSTDVGKLMHQLKGDLDWIVMKCLEKDRTRRYETANGVAFDLKRHLNNETVIARPPSAGYRFQKLVRRNKLAFAAGVGIAAALLLGIIASTWQAVRATHAKQEALTARQQAEASEKEALAAQVTESRLRQQAQTQELVARQRSYASDMNVAAQALAGDNLGRTLDLLNRQRPGRGQKDLRGWEWRYLWEQTHSDALFTLCQEPGEINSLAVSPDGAFLAIGDYHQGGLSVWDLRTRQELYRLVKDETAGRAAFSPVEPLLAFTAESSRTTLRLWNTATRQMVAEIPLDRHCNGLAFSQDGHVLLNSTPGGQITLRRASDGTVLADYPSMMTYLSAGTGFATTPDLSLAAGPIGERQITVFDLHRGRYLWTNVAADVFITALAFSPDKKTLASAAGFSESDIRLWDVATGKETGRLKGHGTWVSSLLFSPDGKKVISGSADQTIRVWDLASQTCVDVLRGHRQEVWRLAWLPDGKTLVSGGKDGTVCLWDTSIPHPRQPCLTVASNILTWHFAPDGQSILILDSQGKILRRAGPEFGQNETLLDLDTNRPPRLTPRLAAEFCCWSPNSQYLALGWTNGTLTVWDLPHKILCRRWTNLGYAVAPVAFFTDGTRLIAEKWFQSVDTFHELDVTTGLEIQSWAAPPHFNGGIAVSPDARWCVATGYDGDAVLRNLADESQTNPNLDFLEGSYGCYSPDGKFVAIASHLGFASVWDTTTWRRQAILGGFLNGASSVSFSPDGKRLAVASGGKEAIKLFDTDSWQEVLTLEAPGYTDSNMEFSPDGSSIGWENMTGDLFVWRAPALSAPDW